MNTKEESMEKTKQHFIKFVNNYSKKTEFPVSLGVATAILMLDEDYRQAIKNEDKIKLNCIMTYLDLTLLLIEAWCIDKNIDVIHFGFNTLYDYAQTLKKDMPQENSQSNPFDDLFKKMEESFEKDEKINEGKDN
jgi:hypothetical protein